MVQVNTDAGIAQLVEHKLPKLGVAGSSPVARSISSEIISAQIQVGEIPKTGSKGRLKRAIIFFKLL